MKRLSMDFIIRLPVFTNRDGKTYDSILVFINWLTKMVYYKPVKETIDALGLIEVIITMVVRHYSLSDSIVSDHSSVFTSKFWFSLCYFLRIKRQLLMAFHPQSDSQTETQNSTKQAYLQIFVNYK